MVVGFLFATLAYAIVIGFVTNSFLWVYEAPLSLLLIIPLFLFINFVAGFLLIPANSKRLRFCYHGTLLLCGFYLSTLFSTVYQIVLAFYKIPDHTAAYLWGLLFCFVAHFIIFWNSILCLYMTSVQLGIKHRVIGALFGWIPGVNLVILVFITKIVIAECIFEAKKENLNKSRRDQKICATKYPLLMVHGFFFRDSRLLNYWGRIPKELTLNGATIFYGNHGSAAPVPDSAREIAARIEQILQETGCEKVNIIAHSKGGLDCRYVLSELGMADKIASLTTINTPHGGCLYANHLLTKTPAFFRNRFAKTYNAALRKVGEANVDFLRAAEDLTDTSCKALNEQLHTPEGVFCQSVGSVMKRASGGKFPLNVSYYLVKHFDGENDGLVSEPSFHWGEQYTLLRPKGRRGISHGDVVDLNRQNIKGFDVREFYVQLVKDLKDRGL